MPQVSQELPEGASRSRASGRVPRTGCFVYKPLIMLLNVPGCPPALQTARCRPHASLRLYHHVSGSQKLPLLWT